MLFISIFKEDLWDLVLVVIMLLPVLVILCIPFSFPSLYLAHRLCRKRFLHSVFNQHVAVMMIFSGRDMSIQRTRIDIFNISSVIPETLKNQVDLFYNVDSFLLYLDRFPGYMIIFFNQNLHIKIICFTKKLKFIF